MILTSTYWPSAITSFSFFFFLVFFLAQYWPSCWTCQLVPIGMFDLGPTQAEAKKKKKVKKKEKKENSKEEKLPFSFRQRKKLKPGFKPCFSQWALPLEYTELDTILVETTTYFPLNVFLIFCQYLSCIPQGCILSPVHSKQRVIWCQEPQLIPCPLFLLFIQPRSKYVLLW